MRPRVNPGTAPASGSQKTMADRLSRLARVRLATAHRAASEIRLLASRRAGGHPSPRIEEKHLRARAGAVRNVRPPAASACSRFCRYGVVDLEEDRDASSGVATGESGPRWCWRRFPRCAGSGSKTSVVDTRAQVTLRRETYYFRPEVGRGNPLNLSIVLSGGKETNEDSPSNGE